MENMPLVVQCLILGLIMFGLPVVVGGCLCGITGRDSKQAESHPVFLWISGQMLLWAVFQLICVPFVLAQMDFLYVVKVFGSLSVLMGILGGICYLFRRRVGNLRVVSDKPALKGQRVCWIIFTLLLVFQLVQAVRLAYGDGDDAYYVAVSAISENAETMYRKLPYTGGGGGVDIRHGLAPFPIWIAFLARVSGMRAVSVAHVAVPLMLIPMTYGIFYLLGKKMLADKEKYLSFFMIFTEVLVMFGDYSFYSVEHFMLARSRQGKAALGSIVLPMLLFLLLVFLDRLQEKQKLNASYWILLLGVVLTGCLCSTMGAFLLCLMIAVTGLCAAVIYRRWKILVPLALCCVPGVFYGLLYVLNG